MPIGILLTSALASAPVAVAEPTSQDGRPSASGRSAGGPAPVLVDAQDQRSRERLEASGAELISDYGAFSLWRVEDAGEAVGARSLARPAALTSIGLRDGALDTTGDVPPPDHLAAPASSGMQLRLVQFAGPVTPEWLEDLTARGARVVSYLPANAYVVWVSARTAVELDALVGSSFHVQYSGPYDPAYRLAPDLHPLAREGGERTVDVTVQVVRGVDTTLEDVTAGRTVVEPAFDVGSLRSVTVRASRSDLDDIASLPGVFNVEPYEAPVLHDERQNQLLAGNVALREGKTVPRAPGYLAWLRNRGFPTTPSSYPQVAVVDTGIDTGSNMPKHPDFAGPRSGSPDRLVVNGNCTTAGTARDVAGHGTLVAGIVGGYNARTGAAHEDRAGYQYGLGVSPYGRFSGVRIFRPDDGFDLGGCGGSVVGVVEKAYAGGADVTNNSWGESSGVYNARAQAYDALTRDASARTPGLQEMLHVFSAGNSGDDPEEDYNISSPGTAKNVLTVGATENVREEGTPDSCRVRDADNASDMADFSSPGPTRDRRTKPDVVAAGTHIQGPASQDPRFDGVCGVRGSRYHPRGQTRYVWSSGTSQAAAAISGAVALAQEYYGRVLSPGRTASPAMLKALMVNTPRYLTGVGAGDTLPGSSQGWGAPNLSRITESSLRRVVRDQADNRTFTAAGEQESWTGEIVDSARPVRVSLAFTDAPGATTGNAWVNDLDLEVIAGGLTYRGNVFSGSTSVTGGAADPRNNLENVFLPPGTTGPVTVRVVASGVNGDGVPGNDTSLDQDYAVVASNVTTR
ncbi:S8 family serine peptidase [Nocardioides sp. CFH 31398]|uniref:S8 family serine peptidase n=1 Tax=Nocardioides sp. CFH 31398 TaxID=2919579 RepID=UPI001F05B58C|nr:S8 family serine peptidase [Nocardioides sp. CFH 31398]MCH1866938.1 S8 family serine peptidase [Nocardioides sp. CFH 31398]